MVMMMEITVDTISQGHERVVHDILLYGEEIETEDGELTIEWPPHDPYTIHIKHPFQHPMVSESCRFGEQMMDSYVEQLLQLHPPSKNSATYYYSNRLFDYPYKVATIETWNGEVVQPGGIKFIGNGDSNGIDQIRISIIDRLVFSPYSRRAMAITWVPELDISSKEPPCLQLIQCFIRDQQLHMVCYFRSNDMLSAWGANAYGLAHLMKYVCDAINAGIYEDGIRSGLSGTEAREDCISEGTLTTISASAHIYWKRDKQELNEFKKRMIL